MIPAGGDLYISSGTWSLVGFESETPILGAAALKARVANERTGRGGYRPLTNIGWVCGCSNRPCRKFQRASAKREGMGRPHQRRREIAAAQRFLLDVHDPVFWPPALNARGD